MVLICNFKAGKRHACFSLPSPLKPLPSEWPFQRAEANCRSLLPPQGPPTAALQPYVCSVGSKGQCAGGAAAHLVGTAEAYPQLSQDLQHAQAAVALDSVKGPDSRQALQKAEVLPHYRTQVGHEEGSDLPLHDKMGECETLRSSLPLHAIPDPPKYPPQLGCGQKATLL